MFFFKGNLRPRRSPRKYLGEYISRGKPKIPPADRILMDPSHKARKNPFLRIREEVCIKVCIGKFSVHFPRVFHALTRIDVT